MMNAHICIAKRTTSRRLRARPQDGDPERPGGAGGNRHRGGNPRPLAEQGNGEGGPHDAGRPGPQGHP